MQAADHLQSLGRNWVRTLGQLPSNIPNFRGPKFYYQSGRIEAKASACFSTVFTASDLRSGGYPLNTLADRQGSLACNRACVTAGLTDQMSGS